MWEVNKKRHGGKVVNLNQTEPMTKEEGEDHFSVLMNSITPVWYWRVNHEYIDFLHATIKRMTMTELNETLLDYLTHSVVAATLTLPFISITTILRSVV